MTDHERYRAFHAGQYQGIPMCATCAHYMQHYIRSALGYRPTCDGHCTYPRIKDRYPHDLCTHYDPKEAAT